MLRDGFQRKIEYLRLSVTDRCNIRCRYCMPESGIRGSAKDQILSFDEITRLVSAFVELGVRSVRITGGEPLVRRGLPELISRLSALPDLEDLSLTTNGILLSDMAFDLKEAGLKRINIHLDTLDPERFQQVTRWGRLEEVLKGIETAQAAEFEPIKINAVLQKGINDQDIKTMALFAAQKRLTLRFIEIMPIGPGMALKENFLKTDYVLEELEKNFTLLPYGKTLGRGPADYFKIVELNSIIGLIHPVSKPFCDNCNRIRISADGRFQDCLAYEESTHLRSYLRDPKIGDDDIRKKIQEMMTLKRSDHGGFLMPQCTATEGMYGIGG